MNTLVALYLTPSSILYKDASPVHACEMYTCRFVITCAYMLCIVCTYRYVHLSFSAKFYLGCLLMLSIR